MGLLYIWKKNNNNSPTGKKNVVKENLEEHIWPLFYSIPNEQVQQQRGKRRLHTLSYCLTLTSAAILSIANPSTDNWKTKSAWEIRRDCFFKDMFSVTCGQRLPCLPLLAWILRSPPGSDCRAPPSCPWQTSKQLFCLVCCLQQLHQWQILCPGDVPLPANEGEIRNTPQTIAQNNHWEAASRCNCSTISSVSMAYSSRFQTY